MFEPLVKKGHTFLIKKGSDLKPAILQTDMIRVGFYFNSAMLVPEGDIAIALENTLSSLLTRSTSRTQVATSYLKVPGSL